MNRACHVSYGVSMLMAVVWCRENGIPVLIRFAHPLAATSHDYTPLAATSHDYTPEMMTVTGRSVIRKLNSKSFLPGVSRRSMVMIVRDQDYEMVRLRF